MNTVTMTLPVKLTAWLHDNYPNAEIAIDNNGEVIIALGIDERGKSIV